MERLKEVPVLEEVIKKFYPQSIFTLLVIRKNPPGVGGISSKTKTLIVIEKILPLKLPFSVQNDIRTFSTHHVRGYQIIAPS